MLEYAILDIYEKLLKNIDQRSTSCAIFLDLAKAFDSVSHDILLKKLERYGIRGTPYKLIADYLKNRVQMVCIGEKVLKWAIPWQPEDFQDKIKALFFTIV